MVWYFMKWNGMVFNEMKWYGIQWNEMVWYSMKWNGMVYNDIMVGMDVSQKCWVHKVVLLCDVVLVQKYVYDFYIVLILLYDAKFFFVQTVVHRTSLVSCTKISVRVKGWIFVQNIAFLLYTPTLVFLCDCFFSISACVFLWFSRFFA